MLTRFDSRLLALALAVVFSPVARGQWTTYQADNQHSGRTSAVVNPGQLTYAWSAPTGYSIPLVVGESVFAMRNQQGVGSDTTTIRSFDRATGAVNWTYNAGSLTFPGHPTYSNGSLFFVGSNLFSSPAPTLHAVNATTGTLQYSVPITQLNGNAAMPTVHTDVSGVRTALVSSNGTIAAVRLNASSGSVLWSANGAGSQGVPTVIGNSAIVTTVNHYYAYDINTGTVNQFHNVGGGGGSNSTAVADAPRNRLFVVEGFNGTISNALTAYTYTNNSTITQLWQRSDTSIGNAGAAAVGVDGKVYVANNTTLSELDGATGQTLRTITGRTFPNQAAPVLSDGKLWIYERDPGGFADGVSAFDLNTFAFDDWFEGGRGNLNTVFKGPGAFADGTLLTDYGNIYNQPGFRVYVTPVPEPSCMLLIAGLSGGGVWLWRRRRRGGSPAVPVELADLPPGTVREGR